MSPRVALALTIALAAVACSDESKDPARPVAAVGPPDGADGPTGATHAPGDEAPGSPDAKKDICQTLDYGHDRPNGAYFLTFDDDAAATTYAGDFLQANGLPRAAEIARDAKATDIVARLFTALQGLYPRETAGLDAPPRIVKVAGQGINAFTGYDERAEVDKAPWLLFVHGAALDHPNALEVTGMFAHELGHLVSRDLLPETRARMRTHYRVVGGAEDGVFGAAADDDPVVRARAGEIREIGDKVGRHAVAGPVPLSPYFVPEYASLLDTLKAQRGDGGDASACKTADDGLAQMSGIATSGASIHEYTDLHLTADQRAALARLGASTGESLRKCYAHVKGSLFELKVRRKALREPAAKAAAMIEKALDPSTPEHAAARKELITMEIERLADRDEARPAIDRVLEVVLALHRRLEAHEADPELPIDELRVFDMEENADDVAVRVLMAMGEDPLANARMWVNLMPDPAACYRAVDGGEIPPYGRFVDPHNDTCWRYYHATQLSKTLAACPPGAPGKARAAPRPAPLSPADRSPSELLRGALLRAR